MVYARMIKPHDEFCCSTILHDSVWYENYDASYKAMIHFLQKKLISVKNLAVKFLKAACDLKMTWLFWNVFPHIHIYPYKISQNSPDRSGRPLASYVR